MPDAHSEPRAEWPDETEARVASILHQEDCPCTSPVHEAGYLDTARIVLSSIEAVPRAEHEQVRDASRALLRKAGMVPLEWEGFWDAARDLAAIVNGDSSLDAAKLKYRARTQDAEDRAFEAESQLRDLRARCEGVAKELREVRAELMRDFPLTEKLNARLYALAGRLGGPDDAPKEPTRELCERPGIGMGGDTWDPVCDLPQGHEGPCNWTGEPVPGSLPEREDAR